MSVTAGAPSLALRLPKRVSTSACGSSWRSRFERLELKPLPDDHIANTMRVNHPRTIG